MDLQALIISHTDNNASEQVRRSHRSAVTKLADLLNSHNVLTIILGDPPSPPAAEYPPADMVFILSP